MLMIEDIQNILGDLAQDHGKIALQILAIIFGAYLAKRFGIILIRRLVRDSIKHSKHESKAAEKQREDTIIQIVSNALNVLVWPIAFIMIISLLGVDVAPLIAGAGILGVALGFGAQSLVEDIIAGLFMTIENQYRVGDVIEAAGITGMVERITLRTVVLRDLDGIVHHIPNGSIDHVSNMSKDYSGINIDIGVAYASDINKVKEIINRVGYKLSEDENWQDKIIEAPEFFRVDKLGDSSIIIKVTGKVVPLQQWAVSGEMRHRVKEEFDKEGIEIPFPQMVVHKPKK